LSLQLFTVRELSIMSTRKAPVGMHFVPNIGPWSDGTTNNAWDSPRVGTNIHSWTDGIGEAVSKQPTRYIYIYTLLCSTYNNIFLLGDPLFMLI
jgi:hypothetical protein